MCVKDGLPFAFTQNNFNAFNESLKNEPTPKVTLNGLIFFSYFHLEDTLCFLCAEQIKSGGHQA